MLSGGIAVALTVIAMAVVPVGFSSRLFSTVELHGIALHPSFAKITSLLSFALIAALIAIGITGSRNPLENPLPLFVWTIWWTAFVVLQGVFGDLWKWLNPWSGIYSIVRSIGVGKSNLKLPEKIGVLPGLVLLIGFGVFALADPAPDDPERLAWAVATYWIIAFGGMLVFGADQWFQRCECFTMLLRNFALLAPIRIGGDRTLIGLPGWAVMRSPPASLTGSVFALAILGIGSFDGLNETFWWLSKIGINPLEHPGRSAIVERTTVGLLGTVVLLSAVFWVCVKIGLLISKSEFGAGTPVKSHEFFGRLSLSILPIALGYHFAHFHTAFLVNSQYALAAASDPLATGADYLGLGEFYVTTGFLSTRDSVRAILLTQCAAIILGHMLAVMLAHSISMDFIGRNRKATVSQIPVAVLMILYTLLSLWLLASPKA